MSRPHITLDKSDNLVLVLCSHCPGWREPAADVRQGLRLGQIHATFVHQDEMLAADFRGRVVRFDQRKSQRP